MFHGLRKRAKNVAQPPGTPIYTGKKKITEPRITLTSYSRDSFHKSTLQEIGTLPPHEGVTWIQVEGLHKVSLIEDIAKQYQLHPLTIEDILNVEQRPKVEQFDHYQFITLRMFYLDNKKKKLQSEQLSIVLGKNFILTFQETSTEIFNSIFERLQIGSNQRLREHGSDYLMYRIMDVVVDYYFVALENIGEHIEAIEDNIITDPQPQNTRTLYRLKRQMLSLRKAIWPMREAVSHLMQMDNKIITAFTRIYLRDLYDHIVQAIDTIETFRDMLSNLLDVYLSSLTNRMNEAMKTLTIIATIFIPITFIASLYGMNFAYMPELRWHYGYYMALGMMLLVAIIMLMYFRRKKWI